MGSRHRASQRGNPRLRRSFALPAPAGGASPYLAGHSNSTRARTIRHADTPIRRYVSPLPSHGFSPWVAAEHLDKGTVFL
jgi:hypothetical protein